MSAEANAQKCATDLRGGATGAQPTGSDDLRSTSPAGLHGGTADSSCASGREPWEAVGSFVIERYVYTNRRGNDSGVQWLVYVVGEDGGLWVMRACKTRREALDVIDKHGTAAARNAR